MANLFSALFGGRSGSQGGGSLASAKSNASRSTVSRPRADYDAIDSRRGALPRRLNVETGPEEAIFKPMGRLFLLNQARELVRNSSYCRHLMRTIRNLTVGAQGGRLTLCTDDAVFNQEASDWFNSEWAKDCDARQKIHFNKFLKRAISGAARDGDRLSVFDDFLYGDGKLWSWESDKITSLRESDFKAHFPSDWKQIDGVVFDAFGRCKGWIVSSRRGLLSAPWSDVSFIPAAAGLYLGTPDEEEREDQFRSVSMFSPVVREIWCIYQMRGRELEAAKAAAGTGAIVKATENKLLDAISETETADETPVDLELTTEAGSSPETPAKAKRRYKLLEDFASWTEYLDEDDDIVFPDTKRPNLNVAAFYDSITVHSGTAFGLYSCFSKGVVSTSYTAFRGEITLSWINIESMQKLLERSICDPVGLSAIDYALRGPLKTHAAPANWRRRLKWSWPTAPEANPVDEANAKAQKQKLGILDLADLLGPGWEQKLVNIGKQLSVARENGVPLAIFETKAGADQSAISQGRKDDSDAAKAPASTEEDA